MIIPLTILLVVIVVIVVIALGCLFTAFYADNTKHKSTFVRYDEDAVYHVSGIGCRLVAEQIKDARHGELVRIPFGIIIKMEDDDDE